VESAPFSSISFSSFCSIVEGNSPVPWTRISQNQTRALSAKAIIINSPQLDFDGNATDMNRNCRENLVHSVVTHADTCSYSMQVHPLPKLVSS